MGQNDGVLFLFQTQNFALEPVLTGAVINIHFIFVLKFLNNKIIILLNSNNNKGCQYVQ